MIKDAIVTALLLFALFYPGTRISAGPGKSTSPGGDAVSFTIKSTVFSAGDPIPRKHTCDGVDVSPALIWTGAPAETQSFVLIVDDPDAPVGTWTHWIIWNIRAQASELPEAVPQNESLTDGTRQGRNDFKRIGYGGPCPPSGKTHRYFFKLYALRTKLHLQAGATRKELERAVQGQVLAQAEVMGKYGH